MTRPVKVLVKENLLSDDVVTVQRIEEGIIEFNANKTTPDVKSLIGTRIDWQYVGQFAYERYKIIDAEVI